MTVLPLLHFPDARLKMPCRPVETFDDTLRTLVRDLTETMRAAPGIGITAAHVGILQRVTVIELDGPGSTRIYVNPVIEQASAERIRHMEGSVSMPGVTEEVERSARIRVGWRDIDGKYHDEDAEGLLAICLQHEIDQLDGIFWIDRLSRLKRDRLVRRFRKTADRGH